MTSKMKLVVLAAALMLLPGAASAVQLESDADRSSGMTRVATIAAAGGTDLEFFSRMLTTYKTDAATFVTSETPVERHFAMVGNQNTGAKIYDITDPTKPFLAAAMTNCNIGQGDIQVTADGMKAAIADQSSQGCRLSSGKTAPDGSVIVDLTDPYKPIAAGSAPETNGSHNNTIHPAGKYLYISTSNPAEASGKGRVPIYDISDPYKPVKVTDFTWDAPNSPHDIRFSHDGKRAYFAGVSVFHVVNTEDPTNPSIISRIVPPGGSIGHDTLITKDKRFLFLGDEAGGGGLFPCPGGAVYAYDLTVEAAPVLLGLTEAGGGPVFARTVDDPTDTSTTTGGCTSHVMDLNPDGKSLTLGWYRLGSRIFDFSSFYNADGTPKTAAGIAAAWGKNGVGLVERAWIIPDGGNTWSAKQYHKVPCYVFSDDLALGFYVSKITVANAGCGTPPAE